MAQQWFVKHGDKVIGPLSAEQLKKNAAAGRLKPNTQLRNGESGKWVPAENVKGLLPATEASKKETATRRGVSEKKKYWAFISYSSKDKAWGRWLHKRLENYSIPADMQNIEIADGVKLGKRLRPVFRDRDELSGSAELGPAIQKALSQSRYLIVLCSPNSAQSQWVNKEIEDFRSLNRDDKILALILEGEPNATSRKDQDSSQECFPPALRLPLEPLAGDLRKEGDGKERGFLKLLAGIAQVGFDELYQRHERIQKKKRVITGSILLAVIGCLTALSLYAFQQTRIAKEQTGIANEQTRIANDETRRADAEKKKAIENEAAAIASRQKTEATLARSNYFLAEARWDQNRVREANQLLEKVPLQHRNLEWYLSRGQFLGSGITCYGHVNSISSVTFSPDGAWLASESHGSSMSQNKTVNLWDAENGRLLWSLQESSAEAVLSPDGRCLATRREQTIKLWDVESNRLLQTLRGHAGEILSVSFSPDGTRLASGSRDKTIKLWDAATGRLLQTLQGHIDRVCSIAFSPDGSRLASGSKTIKLWDTTTGRPVQTLSGHESFVGELSFTTDGSRLASRGRSKIKLWNMATGRELKSVEGSSITFNPNGTCLACKKSNTIMLLDVETGRLLHSMQNTTPDAAYGKADFTSKAVFSPDGSRLACGSRDNTIKIWDAVTGRLQLTLQGHVDWVLSIAFTADGSRLASGSRDKTIKLWDLADNRGLKTLQPHGRKVHCLAFSPDGRRLASGSLDKSIKLWDTTTGRLVQTLTGHEGMINDLSFNPDGSRLASSCRTIKLWDTETGRELKTLTGHPGAVYSVAFSPDGTRLASGNRVNTVKLWDVVTGRELRTLEGHTDQVLGVDFSHDGTKIASCGKDHTIKLWDAATGRLLRTAHGHVLEEFQSVAFSPGGSRMASSSRYPTPKNPSLIKLWDTANGQLLQTLPGYVQNISSVIYSHDGSRLASFDRGLEQTITLWDANTGQELQTLQGHVLAFSPDRTCVASSGSDGRISLHTTIGTEVRRLQGHTAAVRTVAFNPNGSSLVSGSDDQTVKLWDMETRRQLQTLQGHNSVVKSVAFSPDGRLVYSEEYSGTKFVWNATNAQRLKNADWNNHSSPRISPDKRWLISSSGNDILLVDLEFKNTLREKAYRESKARLKPHWHAKEAKVAEVNENWFSATFHRAWVLKAKKEQANQEDYDRFQQAYSKLESEYEKADKDLSEILPPVVTEMLKSSDSDLIAPQPSNETETEN